jgi:hypothetical protein
MEKTIWKGRSLMRDDVKITVDLEAEDTLAVKLKSLQMQGPKVNVPARQVLERQTRGVLDVAGCFEGGLSLLEVDGVSNAVLLRTPKPTEGRFVEVVLKNGDSIHVEARGGAAHLSRENYEKVLEKFEGLL